MFQVFCRTFLFCFNSYCCNCFTDIFLCFVSLDTKKWYGDKDSVVFVQTTPGEKSYCQGDAWGGYESSSCRKGEMSEIGLLCVLTKESGKYWRESVGYAIELEREVWGGWQTLFLWILRQGVLHGFVVENLWRVYIKEGSPLGTLSRVSFWRSCGLWLPCLKVFRRDPLMRQLPEASRIECEPGVLMNSKLEWIRPAGVQHEVQRMWVLKRKFFWTKKSSNFANLSNEKIV